MEPEDWVATNKRVQDALRVGWKTDEPESYNAQERRRAAWLRAKAERRGVPPVAMPVAQVKRAEGKGNQPSPANGANAAGEEARTRPVGRLPATRSPSA